MAEIEIPKSPPPPSPGPKDDSFGTLLTLALSCCVTICTCINGPILFLMAITFGAYSSFAWTATLALISLVCMCIGCFAAKYTWNGIKKASG
ncbi:MAG: hypothetical protein JW779_06270 [Candidatus Thorarchaeota archaeon]|nr:hypothetical protein [Candidatus Thorarchaeota archaeon]